MLVWIDVENAPQVQYLLPFKRAFEAVGAEVVLTARDYGETHDLLAARGEEFESIGGRFGPRKWQKALGLAGRTRALRRFFKGRRRPNLLVSASRPAALAARLQGVPSFTLCDYEYVHLQIHRLTRSYVVYPDVIEADAFRRQGIRADRLVPYGGLKEDISFAEIAVEDVPPYELPQARDGDLVRVLVRPPAEESHYYSSASGKITLELLGHLAEREEALLVFSPRYPWQEEYLGRFEWRVEPLVLRQPAPFVSLLKAVDVVVSSGGTMVREAAYLGVPSLSTFQGAQGGVDRHLVSLGRLRFITSASDLAALELRKRGPESLLRANPQVLEELVGLMLPHARPH
jgi:uncharacterized protein